MFRTELPLTPHPQQLPHSARVLTIGSCFSDSIGNRLADFKVATLVNPFGTVFNPVSACKLLRAAAGEDMDWQQHLVEARGRWQSYDLHATLGADSPVDLLQRIQSIVRDTGVFLATADAVVLTLGTAYAYRLRETDEIISNCHKVPAEKFDKELLTADEIIAAIAETHAYLRRINPRLRFILTVSPVRHLKETLPLSSVSKSMLRVACHYLSELLPDVSYFPAYELLVDDLRDYRFYASDMLHPSDVAENYIWERFTRTYLDTAFGRFKKEWESIRQALAHRPLHIAAPEHRQFLESTLARLQRLSAQADVRMELLHVERELAALPLPPPPPAPEPEEEDEDEYQDEEQLEEGDTARAELLSQGSGLLIEAEDAAELEVAEPDSEEAYESAYSGVDLEYATDEELAEEEADAIAQDGETPVRKKKRRSRGGAKRSKRKAARLAAEAEASIAVTAIDASLEQPTVEQATETEPDSEPAPFTEGITYISEAELFGKMNRPSTAEVGEPALQEEPSLATEEAPAADAEAPDAAESGGRNSRRNRPQRKGRQQEREPRRGTRPALYAVPHTEDTASTDPEVTPTAEQRPSVAVEPTPSPLPALTSEMPGAEESSALLKSRSRNRGGASRNRGNAAQSRVAAAAESAAAAAPQSVAPALDTQGEAVEPSAAPEAPAPASATTPKPRPKRAPRKPATTATSQPEISTQPAAAITPEPQAPEAAPAPKKRPPRKAKATPAPEPPVVAAAPENVAPAPKASRSRKKAANPAPEPGAATPEAKAPAPKRARPPRRKPTPGSGTEPSE
ncbi:hypothetical protein HMJ29_01970 [Hymenobacter taeanensis]|uniref:GSCFA domain-containing protein n=1 Tax=Hymenobacter taeanensis TaxID=2735321 RepID=A0A6M6BDE4_9BACT|nr:MULTISPECIES: GSCFA domain-containing protein [Hymenobacter]QJX45764.1 hypothetical protein HMJ29_01970 [Hymenobacter taeanensis]UOQ79607.1 GSCFA domain-containing protein [Hymenobacter sp. 5414T-23]